MADVKITDDLRAVLESATCKGDRMVLPMLKDRKLYLRTAAALENIGAKWNTKAKAFVFSGGKDARAAVSEILETGKSVDEKKKRQAFYTPPELVEKLILMAGNLSGKTVLEPSFGDGRIIFAALGAGAKFVHGVDIDDTCFLELVKRANGSVQANAGDFLKKVPGVLPQVDAVIMNPPFAGGAAVKHVVHAWRFLKPGGPLVSVMPTGYSEKAIGKLLGVKHWDVFENEDGSFLSEGTAVKTQRMVVWKE